MLQAEADRLLPDFLRRYNAGWVYCMAATAGVSLLERQRRYQEAVDRLQQLLGAASGVGVCVVGLQRLMQLILLL